MDLLEGAAAFAVVMIIFSTIVTGVVEGILRFTATRQAVLSKAVKDLMKREILPRFKSELAARYDLDLDTKEGREAALQRFADQMTLNLVSDIDVDGAAPRTGSLARWSALWNSGVEKLTTYAFLQRVAKSEFGAVLAEKGRGELRDRLTDLARTYERYVAASNEQFRRYAHVWTTVVAALFAVIVNVDAGRVFTHLMDSPEARAALIAYGEEAAEANREQVAELNELISKLELWRPGQPAPEGAGFETVEDMRKAVTELKAALAPVLETHQLPVGWDYYPYCGSPTLAQFKISTTDPALCADPVDAAEGHLALWALNAFVAGVLISLGGPFWYRVFSGLSRLAATANMLRGGRSDTIEAEAPDQTASKAPLTTEDVSTTFLLARKGATQSGGAEQAPARDV